MTSIHDPRIKIGLISHALNIRDAAVASGMPPEIADHRFVEYVRLTLEPPQ